MRPAKFSLPLHCFHYHLTLTVCCQVEGIFTENLHLVFMVPLRKKREEEESRKKMRKRRIKNKVKNKCGEKRKKEREREKNPICVPEQMLHYKLISLRIFRA